MRIASLLVALAACGGPAPASAPVVPAAVASAPDPAFQAIARDLATRTQRQVVGWGEADLGDQDHHVEYAVVTGDVGGAYLLAADGHLFLVPFTIDGRTQVWGYAVDPPAAPTWVTQPGTVITHQQGWHHGYHTTEFAIAGGAVVVRRVEHLEDGSVSQTPVVTPYACAPACTPLANVVDSDGLGAPTGPPPRSTPWSRPDGRGSALRTSMLQARDMP